MDSFRPDSTEPVAGSAEAVDRSPADYLARAVDLATRNVSAQGGPFGAIIVSADGRVFEGVNRVTADLDPTAHAEVSAIRAACRGLATFDLTGATLYSSCEPCPMCLSSSLWARIERVYFAATRSDAANAGFDDALFHRYFEEGSDAGAIMPVVGVDLGEGRPVEPFTAWNRSLSRIDY
ncbi:nucleoside deaminase [Microbacterium sp. 4R-513]|uniref:nucleoside deaminase n=1 Tax=Microbacterium sp. 4R-513 TaxID=2567934 RepID=UPI0013E17300|nr:nucleoside deaminase [Microbacterium sp. 4R-513]QIG38750.1 nucleoside deaminase [Microbacterium sp. 4R-513]